METEYLDQADGGGITRSSRKGKLTGAKPPLQPKHVWAIRTRLQIADRKRDLALFNVAIDSKLRGCDVVSLRVEDVAPHGYAIDRATIRQRKTGRPVKFELTEQTRQAIDALLAVSAAGPNRLPLPRASPRSPSDYPPICPATDRLADDDRPGRAAVWHSFASSDKGNADLSKDRQPAGRPIAARPHKDSKAPSDTSALRWTTRWRSPSRPRSESWGRAETLCLSLHFANAP
jgi:hypothetical protein